MMKKRKLRFGTYGEELIYQKIPKREREGKERKRRERDTHKNQ